MPLSGFPPPSPCPAPSFLSCLLNVSSVVTVPWSEPAPRATCAALAFPGLRPLPPLGLAPHCSTTRLFPTSALFSQSPDLPGSRLNNSHAGKALGHTAPAKRSTWWLPALISAWPSITPHLPDLWAFDAQSPGPGRPLQSHHLGLSPGASVLRATVQGAPTPSRQGCAIWPPVRPRAELGPAPFVSEPTAPQA